MTRTMRGMLNVALAGALAGTAPAVDWRSADEPNPAPILPAVIYSKESAPKTPRLEDLPLKESVSQYGITWTFDKPARVGQFVNGDWYVVGPVTVQMIAPKPLFGAEVAETINREDVREDKYPGKQARNGSMLNPPAKQKTCGFDSRCPSDRYAPRLFAHLPIEMKPGDSLVSTISRDNNEITKFSGQHVDPLRAAAVLSCLAEPVPPDAFRPSYCDSINSKIYLARNLKRELLLDLPRPTRDAPRDLHFYARGFHRPWLDLADFGFAAPTADMPHYGQQMVELEGEAALLLLCDYPAQEKEQVLVGLVQVGLDFYGLARGGMTWQAHGGLNSGRKFPIVLAGILLGDGDLQSPCKSVPTVRFGEDDQTAFGPVTYKGKTYERSWTGSRTIFMGHSPYLFDTSDHWTSGWGLLDVFPPSEWPLKKEGELRASEAYRRANTSGAWVAEALAMRMMHVEKVWDHDAFFAYVDRWMTEDDTKLNEAIKEAKFGDFNKLKPGGFGRQGFVSSAGWVKELWQKYRDNLPAASDGSQTPPAETTWK